MNWNLSKRPAAQGSEKDALAKALSEWRRSPAPEETLSAQARSSILESAFSTIRSEPARSGSPALRRVFLSVVPVLAVVVVLVFSERAGDPSSQAAFRVRAAKNGDQVVFTIANGGRQHSVYKSSVPNSFDRRSSLEVRNGAFRDVVDDGSGLVFYRIE